MATESDEPFMHFEIIINILKRLPIKSIVRFQCVCKEWKNLFKTPSFISEHVRHSACENPFLLIHPSDHNHSPLYLSLLNHKMETAEVLSTPSIDSIGSGWSIVGSCNGLLCVFFDLRWLYLWNPAIREVREIPEKRNFCLGICTFGFGFSSIINDYKIVRIYNRGWCLKKIEDQEYCAPANGYDGVEVCSLSTCSWKKLAFGALQNTTIISRRRPASADGTMVWLGIEDSLPVLISFDIATEVFTSTPIPYVGRGFPTALGVCKNKFVIAGHRRGSHSMDIWVMEKVAGKSFSCTEKYSVDMFSSALDPFYIWRNEILCRDQEGEAEVEGDQMKYLYLFNLTTKEWKKFHNFSLDYDWCDIFNYEKSLVSVSVCNT